MSEPTMEELRTSLTHTGRCSILKSGAFDRAEVCSCWCHDGDRPKRVPVQSGSDDTRKAGSGMERMTCPGCGHEVYNDPMDGWRNDSDGFTCEPPRTTHSEHIVKGSNHD